MDFQMGPFSDFWSFDTLCDTDYYTSPICEKQPFSHIFLSMSMVSNLYGSPSWFHSHFTD